MSRTKAEAWKLVRACLAEETFAHQTLGHFNISVLRRVIGELIARQKIVRNYCRFDQVLFEGEGNGTEHLFANREIDKAHAASLTRQQLEEPLIFLSCPPGTNGEGETQLLVDGVHRMFERHRRGYEDFRFYLFPLHLAPRVDKSQYREIKWGEKDLIPGVGLVDRKKT